MFHWKQILGMISRQNLSNTTLTNARELSSNESEGRIHGGLILDWELKQDMISINIT
jgi:hypothetical protein